LQPEPGNSRQELCELVEALLAQKAEMLQEYIGLTFSSNPKAAAASAASQQQQDADAPGDQQQQKLQQQQQQDAGLHLTGLPLLLDGYIPDLACLPQLVLQLVRDVDWDTEQACFASLATVLANFYALQPLLLSTSKQEAAVPGAAPVSGGSYPAASVSAEAGNGVVQPMDVDGEAAGDDAAAAVAAQPAAAGGLLGAHRDQQQREWLLRHVLMPAVKAMYRPPKERARDGSVLLLTSMEKLYRVFERCGW
jgi:hypothetical protein